MIAPGYMRTTNTVALQAEETRNRQILERIPAGRRLARTLTVALISSKKRRRRRRSHSRCRLWQC
jgi:hypothetical protein